MSRGPGGGGCDGRRRRGDGSGRPEGEAALKRQGLGGVWKPSSDGSGLKGSCENAGPEEGMLWDVAVGVRDPSSQDQGRYYGLARETGPCVVNDEVADRRVGVGGC